MATDAEGRKLVFWQFPTWMRRTRSGPPGDVLPLIVAEPGDNIAAGLPWEVRFDAFLKDEDLIAVASLALTHPAGYGEVVYACVRSKRSRPITSIRCWREEDAAAVAKAIGGQVVPPAEAAAA